MIAWWMCAAAALAGADAPDARIEAPPWKGSKAGRTDDVLAPWTPIGLTQDGPSIELRPWGRVYAFWAWPFPERIVVQDEDLLAGPIEVIVRGGIGPSKRAALGVSNRSPARVTLESDGEAGPLAFKAWTEIEYDGLIRVRLTFEQKGLDPVEEIALAIPLRAECARYLYRYPGRWGSAENAGALPEGGWSSAFQPFIWLGDESRGLAWFCESDRNWSPADPKSAIRIARERDRTICFHEQWSDIQNYPKAADPDRLRALVAACQERKIRLLLYFGYEMSTIAPEWEAYSAECLVDPRAGGYTRKPEQKAFIVCYRSCWQDFIADGIARMMDEYGIDGVYLDGTANPWACANARHGCGYARPDGSIAPTYPFFAAREMMRRIYAIVKARKPEGLVNLHQSTCMTIPSVSWATSYWDGEQFGSIAAGKQDPMALLPLDAFRTEFMGHNWGVPAEFLCYGRPYTYRQALSFTLLHDVPVRPLTIDPDMALASSLWRLFDRFGRKGARWVPHWRIETELGLRADPATISAYVREGEGALIVISNLTSRPQRIRPAIDPAKLGLAGKPIAVTDALAEKPLPLEEGAVALEIQPLDWTIVRVAAKGDDAHPSRTTTFGSFRDALSIVTIGASFDAYSAWINRSTSPGFRGEDSIARRTSTAQPPGEALIGPLSNISNSASPASRFATP